MRLEISRTSCPWAIAAVAAAIFSLSLAACGGGGESGPTPPGISVQPTSASVLTDATATFSVTATGSGNSYQWQKNGSPIPGATAAAYTTPPVGYADNGAQYTVVVSNAGGNVTSSTAQLNLTLSPNQQAFEGLTVGPSTGSFLLRWNLNYSGPEVSGTNYAYSRFSVVANSPLTLGPQTAQLSAPHNLTSSLALVTPTPERFLKNGAILVVPVLGESDVVTYVGSDVKIDTLASDNTTVVYTQLRSDYSVNALSGPLANSPADFAHWYNSFFSNPAILSPGASYAAGASYLKYTATNKGDRYSVFDCAAATTTANVSPCLSSTTLTDALTAGISSASDGRTYHLADGSTGSVAGVPVWVATAARPQSATLSTTVEYRIYFELNGNVYTGSLVRDGTVLGGNYYVSNPGGATVLDRLTFLPYQLRMNKAAHDSISAALAI
jgi:hypothetical protein